MHSYSLGSTDFNLAGIPDAEKKMKINYVSKAMYVCFYQNLIAMHTA